MQTKGADLSIKDQAHVLVAYCHRFTGEYTPLWARKPMPNGTAYRPQFRDDKDWLANTLFTTRKDGSLDRRVKHCQSNPTWPQL
jgi:hypothetical protein